MELLFWEFTNECAVKHSPILPLPGKFFSSFNEPKFLFAFWPKWNADHFNIPQPEILTQFCWDLGNRKLTFLKKAKFSARFIPDIPVLAVTFYSGIFRAALLHRCGMVFSLWFGMVRYGSVYCPDRSLFLYFFWGMYPNALKLGMPKWKWAFVMANMVPPQKNKQPLCKQPPKISNPSVQQSDRPKNKQCDTNLLGESDDFQAHFSMERQWLYFP